MSDLQELQRIFALCAGPVLAKTARVCELTDDGRLTLAVDSNAAATLIRQQQTSLMRNLIEKGVQVTKVRPQVQVTAVMPRPAAPPRQPIPKEFLAKIADNLSDSPLKDALREISRVPKRGKS
jgi:hypothetical protein